MTFGMFILHLSNLATHRHFTIGSNLGNTNTLKSCPCLEASGIKGKWMVSFHRGALSVARWFLGVGALAFTAHRGQPCSTTESHFREPHDQLLMAPPQLWAFVYHLLHDPVTCLLKHKQSYKDTGLWHFEYSFIFSVLKNVQESMLWAPGIFKTLHLELHWLVCWKWELTGWPHHRGECTGFQMAENVQLLPAFCIWAPGLIYTQGVG